MVLMTILPTFLLSYVLQVYCLDRQYRDDDNKLPNCQKIDSLIVILKFQVGTEYFFAVSPSIFKYHHSNTNSYNSSKSCSTCPLTANTAEQKQFDHLREVAYRSTI